MGDRSAASSWYRFGIGAIASSDSSKLKCDQSIEVVIEKWWSQTESNRRPLQCHCHGPTFLKTSTRRLSLPKPFEFTVFWLIFTSSHFPSSLFGGDLVAILKRDLLCDEANEAFG
jgi:hypothetical protein